MTFVQLNINKAFIFVHIKFTVIISSKHIIQIAIYKRIMRTAPKVPFKIVFPPSCFAFVEMGFHSIIPIRIPVGYAGIVMPAGDKDYT